MRALSLQPTVLLTKLDSFDRSYRQCIIVESERNIMATGLTAHADHARDAGYHCASDTSEVDFIAARLEQFG